MLDIKFIRENPEKVKEACKNKNVDCDVNNLLELDKKRKELMQAVEDMKAKKNKATEQIQNAKEQKEKDVIILKMRELDNNSDRVVNDFQEIDKEFQSLMLKIPNIPFDDVPVGKDDSGNIVLREVGGKTKFDFTPVNYLEISEKMDLIDIERAGKVVGTRFGYLKGELAILEFSLVNLVFDTIVKEGFVPVVPPVMLKAEMARGMGYLEQTDEEEAYFLPKDNLYLVGTAEQSVGVMYANEILDEKDLPKRYVAFSTCFRRESGAYGKDTKGILRVHQFDKIEMFSFCKPEKSNEEHEFFLSLEERLMQLLGIPYHVLRICTGDLGRPAAKKYDVEAWMPGQNQYRETHSTSNCTDYQARRLNMKYRDQKTGKPEFLHTVNGTAFAIGRTLIAIIENYQQKDGSIKVPEVLQKYVSFKEIKR